MNTALQFAQVIIVRNQLWIFIKFLQQQEFLFLVFGKLFHMESGEFDIALFVLNKDAMPQEIRQFYPEHSEPQLEMHLQDQEPRNFL